ncbi:nicotinate phosphoribosyltransferase [Geodermatophilus sp. SYSU D00684]
MLVTDLYELTMAAGYLRRRMTATATFRLFVRRLPPGRGFLVAAGVEDAVARLLGFEVTGEDVDWLRGRGWPPELAGPLQGLRFTGDVDAVPEGTVVLAGEPLLEVTAPLPEAQVLETTLLNAVTYQTALTAAAARCVLAARGRPVVDFALRRTHGVEAGLAAARAGAVAGFAATSDVAAAQRYGLAATGTMAHSFVQAFPDERTAFTAFAEDFPAAPTFLVDTYDPVRGLGAAIEVVRQRGLGEVAAVRLDSGDLGAEARRARALLDAAGLPRVRIVVSGGLDAEGIDALERAGAPVDVYAVGTRVGTSADAPLLDSAYKLVEHDGRPVTKLSPGKGYAPGRTQVWRLPDGSGVLTARDEDGPPGGRPLLVPVVRDGLPIEPAGGLAAARRRCAAGLMALPAAARRIDAPRAPVSVPGPRLLALHEATVAGLSGDPAAGAPAQRVGAGAGPPRARPAGPRTATARSPG